MKTLPLNRLIALSTLACVMLFLVACSQPEEEKDTGPNANLSNEDLLKTAVANMKSMKSYHFEFKGGLPSDGIKMGPNQSISGDLQFNGKGSRVKFSDASPATVGPNPDSVILNTGNVDMLIVEGGWPYYTYDGGKTWAHYDVDTPETYLMAMFGSMWNPKEGANGLASGEQMLQDATLKDGNPRTEQVDGIKTRHIVAETMTDYATATVDLWVSIDITPTIRQMRLTGKSIDSKNEQAPAAAVNFLNFSPDGRLLAVGGEDDVIRLWDLSASNSASRKLHAEYESSSTRISRSYPVFSPDGKTLAESTGNKSEVRLWNTSDFDAQPTVLPVSHTVSSLAFRPDGRMLAAATDGEFYLWDLPLKDAQPQSTALPHPISNLKFDYARVGFSPDGKLLATVSGDNFVRVFDVQNPQATPTVLSHSDEVLFTNVAFSPDGHLLVAAGQTYSPTLAIWDLRQPQAAAMDIKGRGVGGQMTFSPDGQTLASVGDNQIDLRSVNRLDAPPQVITDTYPGPLTIAFNPDGSKLAEGFQDGKVRLYDLRHPEAKPLVLKEVGQLDQSGGTPYTLTWNWSRFNEDFGEVKPPPTETIKSP